MNAWKVTWWDGCMLRETIVPPCDIYNLPSFMGSYGVNSTAVQKIERMAQ